MIRLAENCQQSDQMMLSILIPVFNVETYLPGLLDNLLPQLPDQAEIIFYDDVSPDQSVSVIQHYQRIYAHAHIQLIQGKKNLGIARVREKLLLASHADYVWFIDSDDCVEAHAVASILNIIKSCRPDVILFDYDVFFDKDKKVKNRESLSISPVNTLIKQTDGQLYRVAIMDGKHYFWNKVFLRQLAVDGYQFYLPAYEDIANTPAILHLCKTYFYYPETLIHYRIWSDSIVQKLSLGQIYGIEAYTHQAVYARDVLGDKKCSAYLFYKAFIYYRRLCKRVKKSNLSESKKNDIVASANKLYSQNSISPLQLVWSLISNGMFGKAAKFLLILFNGLVK